jgi:UDP-glucuronate 4-epimerase
MRILVTGGAGFIGSHLCAALLGQGHSVSVIDDFNDFYDPAIKRGNVRALPEVDLHEGNICDLGFVESVVAGSGFDAIVHLAARAGVRPSIENPQAYIDTNITGTHNLLRVAATGGVGRFVFASSSSVYGLAAEAPFKEDTPIYQTLSPYAATKLAGEHLCGNYARIHGLNVTCLRLFTVYGPRQRPDLAIHKFTDAIHRGDTITVYGDGSSRRDYTHIDDIVDGIQRALGFAGSGFEIFNLGGNETTALADLVGMIEEGLGKSAIIERVPENPGDMPFTSADISKAREILGYNPRKGIREGIAEFVRWYLSSAPPMHPRNCFGACAQRVRLSP